ncbi:tetratricopeptide repeat protein, partial [Streptomyces recifensis]|uniref:tetratricopeptide repeat protein n=1 Tax=Streptomyces recifensis TaxID=67355 RepID=UPI00111FFF28
RTADRLGEATALVNLAVVQSAQGDLDTALANCTRAAALARQEGNPHTEMLALLHLSRTHLTSGAPDQALHVARTALNLGPEHEEAARTSLLHTVCGEAHLALGNKTEALALLERAADEAESTGYDEGAVRALAALLRASGRADHRRRHEKAARRLAGEEP